MEKLKSFLYILWELIKNLVYLPLGIACLVACYYIFLVIRVVIFLVVAVGLLVGAAWLVWGLLVWVYESIRS